MRAESIGAALYKRREFLGSVMERDLSRLRRERELDPESESHQQAYLRAKQRVMGTRELLDDVTILFEPDFDAYQVTVHGIALEDSVREIPKDKVIALKDSSLVSALSKRKTDPETFELYWQRILEKGGEIYLSGVGDLRDTDPVVFHCLDSRVTRIDLAYQRARLLELTSEKSILDKWGIIDDYSRSMGVTIYAPNSGCFTISWMNEHDSPFGVSLGRAALEEIQRFTAVDLLQGAIEWTPVESFRAEELQEIHELKTRRVTSLLQAFGLNKFGISSPRDLLRGSELIAKGWGGRERELWSRLKREGFFRSGVTVTQEEFGMRQIKCLWEGFIEILFSVNRSHRRVSSVMDEDAQVAFLELSANVSRETLTDSDYIERILALLIDPQQRVFTWGELVRDYGFPDDDLDMLEYYWA